MHIYDERKLVFWSRVSRMKSVVMRTRYGILITSREFNLLTFKYDVITGQCNVCDIREKVFTDFHNTATGCAYLIYMHVLTRFFSFFLFSLFVFASLRCFALYYTALYCLSGE